MVRNSNLLIFISSLNYFNPKKLILPEMKGAPLFEKNIYLYLFHQIVQLVLAPLFRLFRPKRLVLPCLLVVPRRPSQSTVRQEFGQL